MECCSLIALDEAKRRVYWADRSRGTIETVNWEGGEHGHVHREQRVSPLYYISAKVAVWDTDIYLLVLFNCTDLLLLCVFVHNRFGSQWAWLL